MGPIELTPVLDVHKEMVLPGAMESVNGTMLQGSVDIKCWTVSGDSGVTGVLVQCHVEVE